MSFEKRPKESKVFKRRFRFSESPITMQLATDNSKPSGWLGFANIAFANQGSRVAS